MLALFQNDSCVMYLKDIIFERSLSIVLFEESYVFWEKMFFFLACNTHFTSIFTLIAHYFNPRLQTIYENVSIFNVSKRVENIKKKTMKHRKIDWNSVYCCSIFRPKFPIILQFYQSFTNIYSFQWKLANKNETNIKRMQK